MFEEGKNLSIDICCRASQVEKKKVVTMKRKADSVTSAPELAVVEEIAVVGVTRGTTHVVGEGDENVGNVKRSEKRPGRADPTKLTRLKRSIQVNLDSLENGAKNLVVKTSLHLKKCEEKKDGALNDGANPVEKVNDLLLCPLSEEERRAVENIEGQKAAMLSSLEELAKIRRKYEDSEHLMPYGKEPIFDGMFYAGREHGIKIFTGDTPGMKFAEAAFKAEIGEEALTTNRHSPLFRAAAPSHDEDHVVDDEFQE